MIGNEPVPVPGQKLAAFNNVPASTTSPSPSIMTSPPQCDQCQKLILDRFVCFVMSRPYHPRCLACSDCGSQLMDRCFAKMGRLYCRSDFLKYVLLIIYVSKQLSLSLALKKSNISQLLILSISLPFFNNMCFFCFSFVCQIGDLELVVELVLKQLTQVKWFDGLGIAYFIYNVSPAAFATEPWLLVMNCTWLMKIVLYVVKISWPWVHHHRLYQIRIIKNQANILHQWTTRKSSNNSSEN